MTKRLSVLLVISLVCSACAHQAASSEPEKSVTTTQATSLGKPETKNVEYSDGEATMKGFIAYPGGATGPRPAVLVVHEWWGLNEHARASAERLAQLGYVALAVDMYGEGKSTDHPEDAQKFMMEVMSNQPVGEKRFRAAEQFLKNDPHVDADKIAAIGYCFGGAVALHMARIGEDLDAVVSFHGNLSTQEPMKPGAFKGKILVATGAADPFVPKEQVDALRNELEAAGAQFEIIEYPGVVHGFTNPHADEFKAKYNLPLSYDKNADADSWKKMEDLLRNVWGQGNGGVF
jgi:dienelactone hydrolase